jgi:hypothetical protein
MSKPTNCLPSAIARRKPKTRCQFVLLDELALLEAQAANPPSLFLRELLLVDTCLYEIRFRNTKAVKSGGIGGSISTRRHYVDLVSYFRFLKLYLG